MKRSARLGGLLGIILSTLAGCNAPGRHGGLETATTPETAITRVRESPLQTATPTPRPQCTATPDQAASYTHTSETNLLVSANPQDAALIYLETERQRTTPDPPEPVSSSHIELDYRIGLGEALRTMPRPYFGGFNLESVTYRLESDTPNYLPWVTDRRLDHHRDPLYDYHSEGEQRQRTITPQDMAKMGYYLIREILHDLARKDVTAAKILYFDVLRTLERLGERAQELERDIRSFFILDLADPANYLRQFTELEPRPERTHEIGSRNRFRSYRPTLTFTAEPHLSFSRDDLQQEGIQGLDLGAVLLLKYEF